MSSTPDLTDPFTAVRYQFGMLLGVEDFETAQAYLRGKVRLHNAWLHGAGVVWGLRVVAPTRASGDAALSGEIEVLPGLAMDGQGHELHLDGPACVDVGAWYAEHKDDPEVRAVAVASEGGAVDLTLRVELRFKACPTREVPAMSEPCDGSGTSTAFSRVFETVDLRLLPGSAPATARPYRRLRLLFGVDGADGAVAAPADLLAEVAAARAQINASADPSAEFLRQFRALAAADEMDLEPGQTADGVTSLFPAGDESVVLADLLSVHLEPAAAGLAMTSVVIRNDVRKVVVPTTTIQELGRCGDAIAGPSTGTGSPGPRVVDATLSARRFTLTVDRPLAVASVTAGAFSLTQFDAADGWSVLEPKQVGCDATGKVVTIDLKENPGGQPVRLVARGTGAIPLLGKDGVPLGGAGGGAGGAAVSGNDFVFHFGS